MGRPVVHRVVRAASDGEIAAKHRLGELPKADALVGDMPACIVDRDFQELPLVVVNDDLLSDYRFPRHRQNRRSG